MTDPRRPFHRYPNRYFVETGTEEGYGVLAALNAGFEQVVSFELFESSYVNCAAKFRDYPNVRIVNADSGLALYDQIKSIDGQISFWLDGHYTGPGSGFGCRGAPLLEELEQIRKHRRNDHTILIDDRRMLQIKGNAGLDTYFELTEDQVRSKLLEINPNYIIEYADGILPGDILVARPPSTTNDDVKGDERPSKGQSPPTTDADVKGYERPLTKGHISPPPHDDRPAIRQTAADVAKPTAINDAWSSIDRIVYINLARRTDRRSEIEAEIRRVGIPSSKTVRFEAIEHVVGCYGATLSHIAVLEDALKSGAETTLVLEDDFDFTADYERSLKQLQQFFVRHAGTYDVVMLTACAGNTTKKVPIDEIVSRVTAGASGCGYIVRRGYLPTLIDNLKDGAPHLLRTFDHFQYALDRYWRVLQQYDRWLLFDPPLGGQRDSACDTNVKRIAGPTTTDDKTTTLSDQDKTELWIDQLPASTSEGFDILTGLVKPLPETKTVQLPTGFGPDFAALNPTLLKVSGLPLGSMQLYVCIVRHINWIDGRLRPAVPNDNTLINRNLVLFLKADDLTEISRAELIEESNRPKSATTGWKGFEDCRLFSATADRLEFLCTIFDQDGTDKPQMARVIATFNTSKRLWIAADVRPLQRLAAAGEKNWLAVDRLQRLPCTVLPKSDDDDSVTAVYHWNPFLLLRLSGSKATSVAFAVPTRGRLSEGSAAPIAFTRSDGITGYLALVHESHHTAAGTGRFFHRFVFLDPDWTIVARSLLFCFRTAGSTEYCCGMILSHDGCRLLFGVGFNDAAAAVYSVDRRVVDRFLKPVDRPVPVQAVL